jgi:hypothetical protein
MSDNEKRTKPKYEAPIVVPLGGLARGTGDATCTPGAAATDTCTVGGAATQTCTSNGSYATGTCTALGSLKKQ